MKHTSGLGSGAYTGFNRAGNPYMQGIARCIEYEVFDNKFRVTEFGGLPVTNYMANAIATLKYARDEKIDKIVEFGSGTGVSTLEIAKRYPDSKIYCVEQSEGMISIARYKFNQGDGRNILSETDNEQIIRYWQEFREKTRYYKENIVFVNSDFQEVDSNLIGSADLGISIQALHWPKNFGKTFEKLGEILGVGKKILWNTASHFFEDEKYPTLEHGFRYNDFMRWVFDEISEKVPDMQALEEILVPEYKYNLETLKKTTLERGFETKQNGTFLLAIDLEVLIGDYGPALVSLACRDCRGIDAQQIESYYFDAVSETLGKEGALLDTQRKYEIIPIFESVRV